MQSTVLASRVPDLIVLVRDQLRVRGSPSCSAVTPPPAAAARPPPPAGKQYTTLGS